MNSPIANNEVNLLNLPTGVETDLSPLADSNALTHELVASLGKLGGGLLNVLPLSEKERSVFEIAVLQSPDRGAKGFERKEAEELLEKYPWLVPAFAEQLRKTWGFDESRPGIQPWGEGYFNPNKFAEYDPTYNPELELNNGDTVARFDPPYDCKLAYDIAEEKLPAEIKEKLDFARSNNPEATLDQVLRQEGWTDYWNDKAVQQYLVESLEQPNARIIVSSVKDTSSETGENNRKIATWTITYAADAYTMLAANTVTENSRGQEVPFPDHLADSFSGIISEAAKTGRYDAWKILQEKNPDSIQAALADTKLEEEDAIPMRRALHLHQIARNVPVTYLDTQGIGSEYRLFEGPNPKVNRYVALSFLGALPSLTAQLSAETNGLMMTRTHDDATVNKEAKNLVRVEKLDYRSRFDPKRIYSLGFAQYELDKMPIDPAISTELPNHSFKANPIGNIQKAKLLVDGLIIQGEGDNSAIPETLARAKKLAYLMIANNLIMKLSVLALPFVDNVARDALIAFNAPPFAVGPSLIKTIAFAPEIAKKAAEHFKNHEYRQAATTVAATGALWTDLSILGMPLLLEALAKQSKKEIIQKTREDVNQIAKSRVVVEQKAQGFDTETIETRALALSHTHEV